MSFLIQILAFACLLVQVFSTQEQCHPYFCIVGQAKCDYGSSCKCNHPQYSWGDGAFACYDQDEIATEVRNDVVLTSFYNDSVKFKAPVRYLLTSVKLELKKGGHKIGTSTINVHGFNKRINGKIVVDGVEIAVRFEFDYGHEKSLSVITYGQYGHVTLGGTDDDFVENGHYGKDLCQGPVIYSDHANNIEVKRYYNEGSRQYVFEIKNIGFRSTFVPFDLEYGFHSVYVPGLAVAINKHYDPQWQNFDKVIAQPPVIKLPTILEYAQRDGVTVKQGIILRAFRVPVEQNQPGGCKKFSDVKEALRTCDTQGLCDAMKNCIFMLETTTFVRCVSHDYPDTSSDNHLSLFEKCILHYCNGFKQCYELSHTKCHDRQLNDVISSTCNKSY